MGVKLRAMKNILLVVVLCFIGTSSCKTTSFNFKEHVRPVPARVLSLSEKELLSEKDRKLVNSLERLQYIKDYVFCLCLNHSLDEDTRRRVREVDASRGVLFDIGFVGPVAEKVDSLALAYTKRTIEGESADLGGKEAHILGCLEFIRSEELDTFIKRALADYHEMMRRR